MNRLVVFFLLYMVHLTTFGQEFTGTVLNKNDGNPIPYANVYFVELESGTITDEHGVFHIEHYPNKTINIQISFVGFETLSIAVDLASVNEQKFYLNESHIQLDEIILSIPGSRLKGENVVNVEIRKLKELYETAPVSLSEAISNLPGVDQVTTGAGIGKPVIRGLSGNRIITYAQGIRIENQQWGDEHGLGVGEAGIESIEVIKGPSSLLYGSDALGGVLYFVPASYAIHDTFEGFFSTNFQSNSLGSNNQLGLKFHKNEFKLNVFGNINSNADYKTPQFGRVENSRFSQQNFKTALGFNKQNWIANIRYSFLNNDYGIVEDGNYSSSKLRASLLPFQKINNHNLSFENTLFTGDSKINMVLGYTVNNRREFEDDQFQAALDMQLNTFTYNGKWYSPTIGEKFSIIAGLQGMVQQNKNAGEEILIPDASTYDLGIFTVANIDYDHLKLMGGVRGDLRRIDAKATPTDDLVTDALTRDFRNFNFSGGFAYNINNSTFRGNVSSGFRAPNTSELLSNGKHEGTNRYEIGNKSLVSENAIQIDLAYELENEHFSLFINPFTNFIDNYIYLLPLDSIIENAPVFQYVQSKARLVGGEVSLHYHPHKIHWLHIESSFSTLFAQDDSGQDLPLIPATNINSRLKAELNTSGIHDTEVFLQHIYRFHQNKTAPFESVTSSYHLVNLGFSTSFDLGTIPVSFNTGIKNLFNTQYIDHLSRLKPMGIPNQGRNFYVGLQFGFTKDLNQ